MSLTQRGHRPLVTGRKLVGEDTRRNNRSLLLQSLFRSEGLSRADLARLTGLTRATVSDLTSDLEAEGLVAAVARPKPGSVGKPPTLLGIVADSRHFMTLDLSDDRDFIAGVVNLAGDIDTVRRIPRRGRTGADAVALVDQLVDEALASTDVPIAGIGIGTPGLVDHHGTVLRSTNLGWADIPLRDRIAARTGLSTHVVNDANAATLAAFTFGRHDAPNLFLVKLGRGVGAGLILDGRLFTGGRPGAGEIGHVVVDPKGPPCGCGRRGCLETLIAAPRLAEDIERVGRRAVTAAGRRLGGVVSVLVAALRLEEIVISGPGELYDERFVEAVQAATSSRVMPATPHSLIVRRSSLGEADVLLGAAVLVMSEELGLA